jgi:hypothetical protein
MAHNNSIDSYYEIAKSLGGKQFEVYRLFKSRPNDSFTDRQVKETLGKDDMNQVRPRINELIKKGLLYEAKDEKDSKTGRKVRSVKLLTETNKTQQELF